jgi:hypothetical protein
LLPATGGFYFQAFDGSVTLSAAGYDYDIDWTPMSAGLAPAGIAASFAALARHEHADAPHAVALLRARRERPSDGRAAEEGNEVAPSEFDDDMENSLSLAAIEAELKPKVLETFDTIANEYKRRASKLVCCSASAMAAVAR